MTNLVYLIEGLKAGMYDVPQSTAKVMQEAIDALSALPAEPKQPVARGHCTELEAAINWAWEADHLHADGPPKVDLMHLRTLVRFAAKTLAAPPAAEPKDEQVELIAALRNQRQLDRDGVEVGVSRQACDEAADLLESQARQIATLKRERDLAIAHDTQPYPTVWAYEQACKRIKAVEAERDAWKADTAMYKTELLKQKGFADRAVEAINEHNKDCAMMCGEGEQEGVRCKYRPYFPRHCPECPRDLMIEIPLAASLQPAGPTLTEDKTA